MYRALAKPDVQTACSAQPPCFCFANKGSTLYVTSSAIDNVTRLHPVFRQPLSIIFGNSLYSIFQNTVVADIYRHNRWDTFLNVIGSMKLTTERTSLY